MSPVLGETEASAKNVVSSGGGGGKICRTTLQCGDLKSVRSPQCNSAQ